MLLVLLDIVVVREGEPVGGAKRREVCLSTYTPGGVAADIANVESIDRSITGIYIVSCFVLLHTMSVSTGDVIVRVVY